LAAGKAATMVAPTATDKTAVLRNLFIVISFCRPARGTPPDFATE
jgi:hypothetical protein